MSHDGADSLECGQLRARLAAAEAEIRALRQANATASCAAQLEPATWRATFDAVSDMVMVLSPRHEILAINRAGQIALQQPCERLIGRKCFEVVHDKAAPVPGCPCVASALSHGPGRGSLEREGRIFELFAWPIVAADGKPAAFIHVAKDVTEQEAARKRTAQLEEQLRMIQRMEAVGKLAGGIAHDFNNLMSVILSYCDFALEEIGEGDALRADVIEIRQAAQMAASLTRQLLAFGRKPLLEPRVVHPNDLIVDLENMLRRLIGEDIELRTRLAPNLRRIKADPGQLEQVIMNLAVNARDAMPNGGTLSIETSNVQLDDTYAQLHDAVAPGRYAMIAVTDTGCGMDAQTAARVFEPFFTTKDSGKGTGLGLFDHPRHRQAVRRHDPGLQRTEPGNGLQDLPSRGRLPAAAVGARSDQALGRRVWGDHLGD